MNQKRKLELVREFIDRGFGRRRIAKALETTEWEARSLVKKVLGTKQPRSKTSTEPRKKVSEAGDVFSTPVKGTKKTFVKRSASCEEDIAPRKASSYDAGLRVAVLSDIHYPYHDEKAETIVKMFLADYKPDLIILNGDIIDCYAVSSYQKDIKKKMDIQDEIDYTNNKLMQWVDDFPETKFTYLEGNHENRFARIVKNNAPALAALRTLDIAVNLGLEELGIEWVPDWQDMQIGNMLFTHGHLVRKNGSASARAHFDQYGCSVLIGHCHRLAVVYKRTKYGTHALVENGTLCDFDVEYSKFPDWQQGFTTLQFDGDEFAVSQHAIINHKLIANGKVYTV
jgi:predicted phosphodiesterase